MQEKKHRVIVFDTETTGTDKNQDRLVEFGGIELVDGVETGNFLHLYFNPEIDISEEVVAIHGITNEMAKQYPTFEAQVDKLIKFINGAELVAHNSKFDQEMIDAELKRVNKGQLIDYCKNITDTYFIAKVILNQELKKFSLDKLCSYYKIEVPKIIVENGKIVEIERQIPEEGKKFDRGLHSALVDAKILTKVYLKMDLKQTQEELVSRVELTNWVRPEIKKIDIPDLILKEVSISINDQINKLEFDLMLAKKNKKSEEFITNLEKQIDFLNNNEKESKKSFTFKF